MDRAIAAKICTMVVCKLFRFSKIIFFYFILINYANLFINQAFCSKSVNKALKMVIFGMNTLCSILSNCTSKKSGIKIYFLMYFEWLKE